MSKAERLVEMMITINAKRHFTVGELANEFSVSKRTIMRDLRALEQAGFPLYSEVGAAGGYHLLRERILPPITFTENEAKAIFFACQALQYYRNLPFEQETISILKKFLNCLPLDVQNNITQIQNKVVFWIPDRHCDSPLLQEMLHISTHHLIATIRYSSASSESIRTIVPIGLYSMNGLWYCPSYCTTSQQVKEFRIDRIKEILEEKPCHKESYPVPASIHEYLEHLQIGNDYHLLVKLTEIGVRRCETEFLLARGLKKISSGGGIIDLEIRYSTLEWIAEYFLSFGKHAIILEPVELIQLMQTKVWELYQHYHETK